jgi:arylsulfatase A-like enzyme
MNKEFVPYTLALKLKELGFDEGCLAKWMLDTVGDTIPHFRYNYESEGVWFKHNSKDVSNLNGTKHGIKHFLWSAPLWQQAFEWMREKHELVVDWNHSQYDNAGSYIGVSIKNIHLEETIVGVYKSYEEAQEACLTKLLEIVENENTRRNRTDIS